MASLEQIQANRQNARKSTGPRSAEGKAKSRFNALKSGIDAQSAVIPDEDPAKFQELSDEYYTRFQPQTPEERDLPDTLITRSRHPPANGKYSDRVGAPADLLKLLSTAACM